MDTLQTRLSPKDAGIRAAEIFREIMPDQTQNRMLLEGLDYDDKGDVWQVTLGFDTVRDMLTPHPLAANIEGTLRRMADAFAERHAEREVVREFRTIYLKAADGSFVKMDNH